MSSLKDAALYKKRAYTLSFVPIHCHFLRMLHQHPRFVFKTPAQCIICHAWPADSVCQSCQQAYLQRVPRCHLCAQRLPLTQQVLQAVGQGEPFACIDCTRSPMAHLDSCFTAVSYEWPWHSCIEQFKFNQQTGWASTLAGIMAQNKGLVHAVAKSHVLAPMPLHPIRLAERGYNQALLLAKALRQAVHAQIALGARQAVVRHDWLQRTRNTATQHRLPLADRLRNVRNAFSAQQHAHLLQGKRVVLLDDVMTSGASAQAAAQALKEAGAAHVCVVVFARTEKSQQNTSPLLHDAETPAAQKG